VCDSRSLTALYSAMFLVHKAMYRPTLHVVMNDANRILVMRRLSC